MIEFDFNGQRIQLDPDAIVKVEDNLNDALQGIASRYIEASKYLAHFKKLKELEDVEYNRYWSQRYHQLKTGAYEQLYQRKPTEQSLEYALSEDARCVQFKQRLAEHQSLVDQLFGLIHALDMKLEVLKEMGSHIRQQLRRGDSTVI
jgi:HSP90 family molecular chaperone